MNFRIYGTKWTLSKRALVLVLLSTSTGCKPEPLRTVGPTPLRDEQHMREYLASAAAWQLWYDDEHSQFWQFKRDGTFSTWSDGESDSDLATLFPDQLPAGVMRVTGKWQATAEALQLSDLTTPTGQVIEPFTLPLKWIDGKLRIEIGGHHYMRQMGK
jgi:hypothetical protein